MYLTDIRGFTAEDYCIAPLCECAFLLSDKGEPMCATKAKIICKITVHAMGVRGDKGFTLHFARFCREYGIEPQFVSISDMGISFFVEPHLKDFVLDALSEAFTTWA